MNVPAPKPDGLSPRWGYLGFAFYAAHAAKLLSIGEAPNLLWSCHIASLLTGFGILLRRPRLVGVGLCFQVLGIPTWTAALLGGGVHFRITSTLTHLGGPILSAVSLRRTGMPRGTALRAAAVISVLWLVTRLAVPAESIATLNVNLAAHHWFGWEAKYLPYYPYMAVMLAISTTIFLGVETTVRNLTRRR